MTKATFGEIMKAPTRLLLAIAAISLFPLVGSARAEKQTEPQAAGPSEGAEQGTGASLAYTRDARKNLPALTQPDHFVKTWEAVAVQPQVPSRFPEELDRQTLPSPDPLPAGLAWDGKRLWVAGRKAHKLFQIDPQTGNVSTSIPSPGDSPSGLAFDGRILWHTDRRARTLYGIENGKVTKKFVLDWPCAGVAVMPQGLIVSDSQKALLRIVSPENGKVIDTVAAPDGHRRACL